MDVKTKFDAPVAGNESAAAKSYNGIILVGHVVCRRVA